MAMRKSAGAGNADLKMVKLPGDLCPKEYALINEEGFINLLENINRRNRYIFDFTGINTLVERCNERDDFREFIKRLPQQLDPNMSGDEDPDSDSDYSFNSEFDFDKEAKIDEIIRRLDSHNERINKLIEMLKPNKSNNLDTIDEDDEKKGRLSVTI